MVPDEVMVTLDFGRPLSEPVFSIALTTSMPSTTSPNTTCLPSSHGVGHVVTKNYEEKGWQASVSIRAVEDASLGLYLGAIRIGSCVSH
jgi:hypothetical protein